MLLSMHIRYKLTIAVIITYDENSRQNIIQYIFVYLSKIPKLLDLLK